MSNSLLTAQGQGPSAYRMESTDRLSKPPIGDHSFLGNDRGTLAKPIRPDWAIPMTPPLIPDAVVNGPVRHKWRDDDDDTSDCWNCGGEGFTYGCSWDWQCDTYDEGEGNCLCTRRCEWCAAMPPARSPVTPDHDRGIMPQEGNGG